MSVPDYINFSRSFFAEHAHKYDLSHKDGCGKYTEVFIKKLRAIDPNVGHLRKYGTQTQYKCHAIDALLYYDPTRNTYQSVDFIGGAETSNASPAYTIQEVYYSAKDWSAEPPSCDNGSTPKVVPWVAYNEGGFERLKKMLASDYARRPQGADFDVSVWASRYFHNCYMGPEGIPLGEQKALEKVKPELCAALGISDDGYYGT